VETRTPGSESGSGKRASGNASTAPRADSTSSWCVRGLRVVGFYYAVRLVMGVSGAVGSVAVVVLVLVLGCSSVMEASDR
jgi:uncharacterized protein YceK